MPHYNLLNVKRNFLACFSPKAACNTLKYWFSRSLLPPDPEMHRATNRHAIKDTRISEYGDYHRVFFIRDPFSRLVGYYCKFIVSDADHDWFHADRDKRHSVQGKTFAEFVAILHSLSQNDIRLQHHLTLQSGNVSNIAFDTVIAVEFLERDLPVLNAKLGFQCQIPRLNATIRSEDIVKPAFDERPETLLAEGMPRPQYFYNPEIVVLVGEIYEADIEYYEAAIGPCIAPAF